MIGETDTSVPTHIATQKMDVPERKALLNDWLQRQSQQERLELGISFQNLDCYGSSSAAEAQPDALTYLTAFVQRLFRKPQPRSRILHDFNGMVRPGEMLLVLGRPGSGCSSLLKVLSGELHGIGVSAQTKIEYSGLPYADTHKYFRGESIYLAELDAHFAELTLGETLTFAVLTRQHGREDNSPAISSRNVANLFGLGGVFNTKMGNAMIRGVSGGETRRTSIAEAFIGGARVQCWDNSTRGLDSATARRFIDLLRASTDVMRSSIVMSIYQSSDAMYQNFDNVTLLYQGRQIYFGPTKNAVDYFTRLGFAKHERASIADFLTSITNPAERVVREGFENRTPRTPDEFAAVWKQSPEAAQLVADVESFRNDQSLRLSGSGGNVNSSNMKELLKYCSSTYPLSIIRQILVCVTRGMLRIRNNYVPPISQVFANGILAIVVGSVYYDLPDTAESMQRRSVLLFFSLMICAFSPGFEVLTMWAQRPMVEKHHRYGFYHPLSEGVSSMLCDLPAKLATSILFHAIVYFMTNLRRTASAFFTHLTFMFFIVLTMSMVFRSLGSLSRTMEQTMAPASTIVLLSIVYTGFVIPVPYMKPWLSWFRRVDPMAYAYESLMLNEFYGREFPCLQLIPNGPEYDTDSGKICPIVGAAPGQSSVLGSSYVQLTYGFEHGHLWRNFGIILAIMVIFCVIHLCAAEFVPAERSKGEIPVFRSSKGIRLTRDLEDGRETAPLAQEVQDVSSGNGKEEKQGIGSTAAMNTTALVFNWQHLSYQVKVGQGSRKILTDIDGWVQPGTVTALMGVTGAGKTTLLDVLANRASYGTATGEVRVGNKTRDKGFQRKIGYVQQNDIHLASATVREALEFSAFLRQPESVPRAEKMKHVQYVIDLLEMENYAEAVVGIPGYGLNVEQRKRLSIGVELAAKPELLLFLDEPTSGLDSQTAWSICKLLRKLSQHGHAILCTIHQPSSQIFAMFDRLLLLNDHGQTIYFGEIGHDAATMVGYFEQNGAGECKPGQNPAEWVLDLATDQETSLLDGAGKDKAAIPGESSKGIGRGDTWADVWNGSEQHGAVQEYLTRLSQQEDSSEDRARQQVNTHEPAQTREFAASMGQQFWIVTKRAFQQDWRDPTYLYSKLFLCIGVSFFNGVSFYQTPLDLQGFTNFLFSIFLLTNLFSTIDQQVIPRLIDARTLFEARERRSKSYSWTVFLTANILVEMWWQTVAAVIVYASWYYLTLLWRNGTPGFDMAERGGLTFVMIWLFCLWITTFSQLVGIGIPHAETAVQLATLCFWLSLVFCGVLVPYSNLPRFWKFVYRASPLTYFINGIVLACLSGTSLHCSDVQLLHIDLPPSSGPGVTCGDYLGAFASSSGGTIQNPTATGDCLYCPVSDADTLLKQLGMPTDHAWRNVGLVTVYVVFNMVCTYGIYWLTRVYKRERVQ